MNWFSLSLLFFCCAFSVAGLHSGPQANSRPLPNPGPLPNSGPHPPGPSLALAVQAPGVNSLDRLFAKLLRLDLMAISNRQPQYLIDRDIQPPTKPPLVRIIHYGDSVIGAEVFSGDIRRHLQKRFGDGGRGLVSFVFRPDYRVAGWRPGGQAGFYIRRLAAGQYRPITVGPAWFEFRTGQWAYTRMFWKTPPERVQVLHAPQKYGRARFYFYNAQKENRIQNVQLDEIGLIDVAVPPNSTGIKFTAGYRQKYYGFFGYNSWGVNYSTVNRISLQAKNFLPIRPEVFTRELSKLKPDVIIFQVGKNDSGSQSARHLMRHRQGLLHLMAAGRAANPQIEYILISPAGLVKRSRKTGRLAYYQATEAVIATQNKLARAEGAAFFNMMQALGGPWGMLELYKKKMALSDYFHFSRSGGTYAADIFLAALLEHYNRFLSTQGNAGQAILDYYARHTEDQ